MDGQYYIDLVKGTTMPIKEAKELFEAYKNYFDAGTIKQVIKEYDHEAWTHLYSMMCAKYNSY